MAEMLRFKKGLFDALPAVSASTVGTVYVTTDEQAMYVDVAANKRIRLSDIIQVDTVNKLRDMAPEYSSSALYYVIDENALLKYTGNGTNHTWKQINSVSDVTTNLENLTKRVKANETAITGLQTAIGEVPGLIATAKAEAIADAAADATTKANTAESNAKKHADDKIGNIIGTVESNLGKKVDTTTFNAKVEELTGKISTAESSAKTHAEEQAADALASAKSYTDTEIGKVNTKITNGLAGKVDNADYTADQNAQNDRLAVLEGKAYVLEEDITTEIRASVSASDEKVSSEKAVALAVEAAKTDLTSKIGLKVDQSAYDIKVGQLETAISNGDTATLNSAKTYAEEQAADALDDAKEYTDAEVVKVNKTITDGLALKVNNADYTTKIGAIEGNIKTLQDAQDDYVLKTSIATSITGTSDTKVASEKAVHSHVDSVKSSLQTAITGKVDKTAYDNTIAGLNKAIAKAQSDAEATAAADATSKANAAESNAKDYVDGKIGTINGTVASNLSNKLDTSTFNTTLGSKTDSTEDTVYGYINSKDAATLASAKKYTDDALATADAMTFKGVIGGTGNLSALPAAADTKAGDTYKVGAKGTYAGYTCYVGDLLIAQTDGDDEYYHITSGYEDDYDPYLGNDIDDNKIILKDTVNEPRGSIKFVGSEGMSVAVSGEPDALTGVADSTVTIGMTWGSF